MRFSKRLGISKSGVSFPNLSFLIPKTHLSCDYLILPPSPFHLPRTIVPHASAISPRFESWIVMGHQSRRHNMPPETHQLPQKNRSTERFFCFQDLPKTLQISLRSRHSYGNRAGFQPYLSTYFFISKTISLFHSGVY